ncbi:hNH endonuclease [Escherichia coli]|nr:hNH endonuclease [Escherichia coli]EFI3292547.1 hNH endonuclease [Escherichia coli]EFL9728975.1 hNH endonuclease [Escherichia coli]
MKQMTLIEMDGFLKGKCIPSDLKVNETNAEYLVRKFGEIESKIALLEVQLKLSEAAERAWESSMMQACGEDGPKSVADKFAELESKLETALRECRSAGITIDNLEAKCAALAAENARLKSGAMDEIKVINRGGQAYCVKDGVQVNPMYARGWNDYRAKSLQSDTPATDAFLTEIERKAIRKFINSIEHILRDKLSPYDTEEMLEAMRIFLEEQGGEQK